MPELGKYAAYVLGSYGVGVFILAAVLIMSLRANARARRELEALEKRHGRRRG
ncbi:MAG: heme exporter protein D [Paracoccaceae bacterium]|jgi:heme exporter protein D